MEYKSSLPPGSSKAYVYIQDGRKISVAESQSLGYPLRTACEPCRTRKLRCSGLINGECSCFRCQSDKVECFFATRRPIGRPRKRPISEASLKTDELTLKLFENTCGIDNQSIPSPASLTATDSPDSLTGSSTPRHRLRKPPTGSPIRVHTPPATIRQLTDSETESVAHGDQVKSSWSSADLSEPPSSHEHISASPLKTPMHGYPDNSEPLHSSLSDLSLAAFVESLYTLEIAPSDGLTSNMLASQFPNHLAGGEYSESEPWKNDLEKISPPAPEGMDYAESAFIHDNLAFSVPSDMRWWDAAWNLPEATEMAKPSKSDSLPFKVRRLSELDDTASPDYDTRHTDSPAAARSCQGSMPTGLNQSSSTQDSCCGMASDPSSSTMGMSMRPPYIPSRHTRSTPEKVHCVPNPSGSLCSCRCDSGLALLSLERSLRHKIQDVPANNTSQNVMSSLVFTLSMSQSVSQKCSCSADCPTCKNDPSHRSNALLLISTALQIYTRALQLFHEVLVADGPRSCRCDTSNCCDCSSGSKEWKMKRMAESESSIDVRIGDYLPSGPNSRKIALYALKLELIDLERALARVSSAADRPLPSCSPDDNGTMYKDSDCDASASSTGQATKTPLCLNPIDRLVIRKLHTQLNEVLQAVDGMGVHQTIQ